MKTKSIYTFLAVLIFASIACGANPPTTTVQTHPTLTGLQAEQTRVAIVDTQQETFFTPDTWSIAPQSCVQSMTMIISENKLASSGTIIAEEKYANPNLQTVWVYYLLVSDHGTEGTNQIIYTLIPGTNTQTYVDYQTGYLHYQPVTNSSGTKKIDVGVLSLISLSKIDRPNTSPHGIDKIKSGEYIVPDNTDYYAFGYPSNTFTAQFSISRVEDVEKNTEPYNISFLPTNTTIYPGSSGGAICDSHGNVVAVTTSFFGSRPTAYNAVPLPQNITTQINSAVENSHNILTTNGITMSP